jgi:hypothetical protein
MSCRDDGVPAVEIKIGLAISRVDPNVLATLDDERKLLVGRDLVVLFDVDEVF